MSRNCQRTATASNYLVCGSAFGRKPSSDGAVSITFVYFVFSDNPERWESQTGRANEQATESDQKMGQQKQVTFFFSLLLGGWWWHSWSVWRLRSRVRFPSLTFSSLHTFFPLQFLRHLPWTSGFSSHLFLSVYPFLNIVLAGGRIWYLFGFHFKAVL